MKEEPGKGRRSMPNMTGQPQCRTMEMNGGSSAPHLARTPCVPCFVRCLIGVVAEGLLDYQGQAGIISIVRWNLRPVIFGVEESSRRAARREQRGQRGESENGDEKETKKEGNRGGNSTASVLRATFEQGYHLSQNYYITARYFWTINFGRRNVKITSQKLFWNYFWAP